MNGYHDDIEQQTIGNDDFRRVLYTGKTLQLVLMTLQPGEEIGAEVHIDDNIYDVVDGSGLIVPAGARHNVRNTGDAPLKMYTLYGPPEHLDGITQATKADAEARHHDEEWDGKTTE